MVGFEMLAEAQEIVAHAEAEAKRVAADAKLSAALAKVSDKSLRGRLEYLTLTRKGAKPAYTDLTAWLKALGPDAERLNVVFGRNVGVRLAPPELSN